LTDVHGKDSYEMKEVFNRHEHEREPTHAELRELKKREVERKIRERYGSIEWKTDGRRVVDEDYDEDEPAYERKLHIGRINKEKLNEEDIDMLLEEDL